MTSGHRFVVLSFVLASLGAAPPGIGPIDPTLIADATPRLVAARYAAAFADGGLSGTLEWDVANPSRVEATWAFAPPRVALAELEWNDGDRLRMARFPGDRLAIAVPTPGGTISGEWSARSAEDRGARRFEFRFPVAGIATLDLTVPDGIRPVARAEEALRSGPFATDKPTQRRWRFSFGGRDRLTVVIPAPTTRTTADPGPLSRASRWAVAAGRADGVVTVTPERPFVAWDDVTFAVDPSARVAGVTADGPCDWSVDPPTANRQSALLRVRPLDPDGLARVVVALRSDPPTPGEAWLVPTLRPLRRAPADDSIVVRADESLRLANGDAGDYRLDAVDRVDGGESSLRFEGVLSRAFGADRRPPQMTFVTQPPDVTVSERATLFVDTRATRLHVVATVSCRRGPLPAIRVTAPEPYRFAVSPLVSGEEGSPLPDPPGRTSDIAFADALGRGQSATITVSLIADTPAPRDGVVRLAVPALTWEGAERTGTVTVRYSSSFPTVGPVVIAYQDASPPGDVIIPVAVSPVMPTANRVGVPSAAMPVSPDSFHTDVHVGRRSLDVTIRGPAPADVPLPDRFSLESVRVGGRWRDLARTEGRPLSVPAVPGGEPTFEIRGTLIESDHGLVRSHSGTDLPGVVVWHADADVLTIRVGETMWAIRSDALDATSRLAAAAVAVLVVLTLRRGGRGATASLFLVAAACGGGAAAGAPVALPAAVALAGLAVAFVVPRSTTLTAVGLLVLSSSAGALPPVAIANVHYAVSEGADDATVTAVWDVSARGPGPHAVTLPLTGANVASVRLDDATTFPDPLAGGGLALSIEPGDRRVEVTFVVPIRRIGSDRELRFDGPDVPRGTLTFTSSPGTTAVSVSSRRGRQETDGVVTRADLGEGRAVVVRWRPAAGDPAPAPEPTLDASLVDVTDGLVTTTASVVFPASRAGGPLALRLPDGWAADRVTLRRAGSNAVVPSDGAVEGRILTVTPRAPVEGGIAVHVVLSPVGPPASTIDVPFVRSVDAPDPHALVAVRLDGVTVSRWQKTGAVDWPADAAAKALADGGLDGSRPVALAARRTAEACMITLTVAPVPTVAAVTQRLSWTVGRRGDVTADVTISGAGATAVVPVPRGVQDVRLRGTEARGGRRDDGSFELVRPPDDDAPVRWSGSIGDLGPGEHTLPLPPGTTTVRVRAAAGWAVRVAIAPGVAVALNDTEAFSVAAGVKGLRVTLTTERPPASPPPVPRALDPAPVLPAAPTFLPSPAPAAKPAPRVLAAAAWLAGLGAVAAVGRFGRGRLRPECVAGLGLLGTAAVGPAFVAVVVLGLVLRLGRTVLSS